MKTEIDNETSNKNNKKKGLWNKSMNPYRSQMIDWPLFKIETENWKVTIGTSVIEEES